MTKIVKDGIARYDYVDIRYMGDACIALDYGTGGNVENDLYHNSMKVPVLSETVRINRAGRIFHPVNG